LKVLASKASVGGTLPWVRIPPSPPYLKSAQIDRLLPACYPAACIWSATERGKRGHRHLHPGEKRGWPMALSPRQNRSWRQDRYARPTLLFPPCHRAPHQPRQAALNNVNPALLLQALEEADWQLGGPEGAATKLGLKRTTLMYKLKKLGISRPMRRSTTMMEQNQPRP
jgi:hypothetical protein